MDTVADDPQVTGDEGLERFVFHRHSRTVIFLEVVSMATNWKDNLVSSVADIAPFMGESARKQFSAILLSGPCQT